MLQYQLLKNNAGLAVFGDYESLRALHELVHRVNDQSILVHDKDGVLVEFAYEVRKAFQGDREVEQSVEAYPEIGPRFGFKVLWPEFLYTVRLLRQAMSGCQSSRSDQALLLALEGLADHGIEGAFGKGAKVISHAWDDLNTLSDAEDNDPHPRIALFASWNKTTRSRRFAGLIRSFRRFSAARYETEVAAGVVDAVNPADIELWRDRARPEPNW